MRSDTLEDFVCGAGFFRNFVEHGLFVVVEPGESSMDLRQRKVRVVFMEAFGAPPVSQMLPRNVKHTVAGLVDPNRMVGIAVQVGQLLDIHAQNIDALQRLSSKSSEAPC